MGINNTCKLGAFFVLFVCCLTSFAQHSKEDVTLISFLKTLEQKHNIQFNYAVNSLEEIDGDLPNENLPLRQIVLNLETAFGLKIEQLTASLYTIKIAETQIFCGYVLSEATNVRIQGATIQVGATGTTSDADGYFEISLPKTNAQLLFRHLGFEKKVVTISFASERTCPKFFLTPLNETLDSVTLSAYLVDGISKTSRGSVAVTFEKFGLLPGLIEKDVLQTVQALPGIFSIDETVSNLSIRGGSHDQNLILWDGIKMYQSGHFFGLISNFNPQITQKAELIKNGSHSKYTDGVSGTISMQTDRTITKDFTISAGINFLSVDVFSDIPLGKASSLQVAARKSINEWFTTPAYRSYFTRISQDTEVEDNVSGVENSDKTFGFYDLSFRWLYEISDTELLQVNFVTGDNDLSFFESTVSNATNSERQSTLTQNNSAGRISYKRFWNELFTSEVSVYETDYKLQAVNVNVLEDQRFLQENTVSETGAKLETSYYLNNRFTLSSGYTFTETEIVNLNDIDTPRFLSRDSEVLREHGLYAQLDLVSNSGNTNLGVGGRLNYINEFQKFIAEPRLQFRHVFQKYFTFSILGEFKHQTTSQVINFQNDFLGIEKRRWQMADNVNIPVLESKHVSGGISFQKKGWLIDVDGYFKTVNGITSQSQSFQTKYEFTKTQGSYEVYGGDLLLRKKTNLFTHWIGYSIMENQYTFEALPEITFPSNFDLTHVITYGSTYSNEALTISGGFNYHTGKPTTLPLQDENIVEDEIQFQSANSDRIDDYFRVDLSALYTFTTNASHKIEVGASVWNLLDTANSIEQYFRVSEANTIAQFNKNALERTFNTVLRFTY
ncbi:TonB-dependent receptor [Cochleicola gelatinilyticus]|uniref:TonB-dependent receptor plug domain-containing protein n=1 Tax=Cochleicola gelatinilyticus TaxID=1763537 RepID=A0A167KG58_9FLAO|nr:carboxypeptidase-like regulatory domain-containing protein [Cochleicola gelatinilyticus]OAB81858.1 hypothetical protein ULVI_00555 [Cochleicola gelatinilyticus]